MWSLGLLRAMRCPSHGVRQADGSDVHDRLVALVLQEVEAALVQDKQEVAVAVPVIGYYFRRAFPDYVQEAVQAFLLFRC